jgi:outer membrane protein OmpA-like peptidoglycan-associated protein
MDMQAKELEQVPGTQVTQGSDRLTVNMQEQILFDTDSANLKPGAMGTLGRVAEVLNRYPESRVIIKGHTDNTGTEQHNMGLSERRAQIVRNYFVGQGVDGQRLTAVGFGESMPLAGNSTSDGRARNRRVELEIIPQQQPAA